MSELEKASEFEMADPTGAPTREQSPLSISLLFYLVTLGAILSACIRSLVGNEALSGRSLAALIVVGICVGCLAGVGVGLIGLKRWSAAGICGGVGLVVGGLAGCLAAVSSDHFLEINAISCVGCWLLIVTMLISARYRAI